MCHLKQLPLSKNNLTSKIAIKSLFSKFLSCSHFPKIKKNFPRKLLTLSWLYKIFFILQSSQMCPFPKGHDFAKYTQLVCFLKVFYFFKRTYPKLSLQTFQISLHFQKLWKHFWKLSPQKTHSLTFKKYPQSLKCTRKNVLNSQKMTSVTPMSSLSRCKTQIGPHKDRSTAQHTHKHTFLMLPQCAAPWGTLQLMTVLMTASVLVGQAVSSESVHHDQRWALCVCERVTRTVHMDELREAPRGPGDVTQRCTCVSSRLCRPHRSRSSPSAGWRVCIDGPSVCFCWGVYVCVCVGTCVSEADAAF